MQSAAIEMFYLFFQGVLTFQVIFFGVLYFIVRRKDLLYYSLFLFFAATYFFINAPHTFFGISEDAVWNSAWYDYFNTPVIIVENFFYLLFLRAFFADITIDKTVKKVFDITLWSVPVLLLLFVVLTILQLSKQFIFYTVNLISIIPAIAVAYMVLKRKLPFSSLVAKGLLCTITGTFITVSLIVLRNYQVHHLLTDGYPLLFIRLGILGDMVFYQAAIFKKWHYQEKQLAVEKVKSELAVEQLRNKISSELHDDFGSTLSGISMYSYMTSDLLKCGEYEKATQSLGIIQKSANQMVSSLSDLVWTINPKQDSFEVLLDKLEEYGREICAANLFICKRSYQ
jgi:signal transduction histidine kinase